MKLPTEEGMQKIVESYWKECKEKDWLPTKLGLCLALDITRETYNVWKKKSYALKKAEDLAELAWIQELQKQSVAGIIFYLKNAFGYRDSRDLDVTSKGKRIGLFDYAKNRKNDPASTDDSTKRGESDLKQDTKAEEKIEINNLGLK